ncbi:MAG TPA: transketolase C-terminal domain-containing protein, partial [Bacteroidota bacterium]
EDTIFRSVKKTNRVIVAHEDTLTGGFGGELVARIVNKCFEHLDAPVLRVAALDMPVPYAPALEEAMLPSKEKIMAAVDQLIAY